MKNCWIITKFGVVLDMDPMIMIVVTKRQKGKKTKRQKGKKTKTQKCKKAKRQKDKQDKQDKKYKKYNNNKNRGPRRATTPSTGARTRGP